MRIACTSDTHGQPFTIPPCDVFVHAGDITARGTNEELAYFSEALKHQSQIRLGTIIVPGNHDGNIELDLTFAKNILGPNVKVLVDSGLEFEGKTFWGSPWTPPFKEWSFMGEESFLEKVYAHIPDTLDMLITHGPPFGVLDPGHETEHAGSPALRAAIAKRSIKHHVFGHLHAAGGRCLNWDCVHYHNVACCDETYIPVNKALILDI